MAQAMAIAFIGILLSGLLWSSTIMQDWETKSWDVQARLFATPSAHSQDIVLILLDQQSIDWVNDNLGISWPWPRELHGAIISNCKRRGAKAIGVDIIFSEPSFFGVDDDEALGAAFQGFEPLALGSVSAGQTSGRFNRWPSWAPHPTFAFSDTRSLPNRTHNSQALFPIPELANPTTILSHVNQQPDQDGIFRSLKPFIIFDQQPLPNLGIGTYLAANRQANVVLEESRLSIGLKTIHLTPKGTMLLRFRGPSLQTYQAFSAAPLIHTEMRIQADRQAAQEVEQDLQGKYVFYGFSAPGLMDLRPTPMGGKTPGVEIHATTLDNLLANDFVTPINIRWQFTSIAVLSLLAGLLILRFKQPLAILATSFSFALLPFIASAALYKTGYQLYILPMACSLLVTLGLGALIDYLQEGRKRRFIKHSFKHYLSPHVIEQLIQNPDKLQLGGERKEISIFFSDLQGFTSISENLEPEELTQLLNEYLTAMTDIIQEEQGTVDKYEGDAIIALWNAPLATPDHAMHCVRAALRCQAELARLRPRFKQQWGHELHMRIGINTGPAVVGNFGSTNRFDYTMLGDAVNLAARLEGANKQFSSFTMISQASKDLLAETFPVRELARLQVVGRHEPVTVFEPFLRETFKPHKESLATFQTGLESFYAGDFHQATQIFNQIAGTDCVAQAYVKKCTDLLRNPPEPREWQGVWSLKVK